MPKYCFTWSEVVICETQIEADNENEAIALFKDGEFYGVSEIDRQYDDEFDVFEVK